MDVTLDNHLQSKIHNTKSIKADSTANPFWLMMGAVLCVAALLLATQPTKTHAQTTVTEVKDSGGETVFKVFDDGALLGLGESSTGVIPKEGTGTRMMWYPGQAAFRAGEVTGAQWNDSNIGTWSVAFGLNTKASASKAVAMGIQTTASGLAATAMGQYAKAENSNTFVWSDGSNSSSDPFSSSDDPNGSGVTGSQTFHVKATSGVRFITSGGATYIPGNSTGWSTMSTRSAKTDVTPVDPTTVLTAVRDMPISTWEYKNEKGNGQGSRHIGPMAEDFHRTLPYDLDGSNDHINSINADGVALGAVKGLAQKVERQQATIDSLEQQVREIQDIKEENEAIKQQLSNIKKNSRQMAGLPLSTLAVLLAGMVIGVGFWWRSRKTIVSRTPK